MRTRLLLLILVLMLTTVASADIVVDVESTSGVWSAVQPPDPTNFTGLGTSQIRWGDPAGSGGQSGYNFVGVPPPVQLGVSSGNMFQLGTFTHLNRPIYGTSITGATLDLTMNFQIPGDSAPGGTNVTQTFQYFFSHNETPNVAGTCLPGSVSICDDEVKVLNTIPDATIDIGGTLYTIEFLGFSKDGGTTIVNDFLTAEDADNPATLYGRFTTNVIPEPGTWSLLAMGLGGLFLAVRRRR